MNLADINDAWNKGIFYLGEPVGEDAWQTPSETLALGMGDCEDIAMGKYFTIQWLMPEKEPKLVICRINGLPHVVVTVGDWVLDNAAPNIVRLENRPDLTDLVYADQSDTRDPRFAYTVARMDMVKEVEAVLRWLAVLGLVEGHRG